MDDLRDFIRLLRDSGELVEIDRQVDPVLEITEIADRVVKAGGPALLFRNVHGSRMPVFINQFGSDARMALALRSIDYEDLASKVSGLADLAGASGRLGPLDKLKTLSRLNDLASLAPRRVRKGVCQEEVLTGDAADLGILPVLKCWPLDGGKFITLPVVFTRDAVSGRQNAGMYRMQIYDGQTTGMHWHLHKDAARHYREAGGRMEVAVAIGTDPAVTYAATAPLPPGVDEMLLAGLLRGSAVDMVPCRTVDLEVPAHAEVVLEGYVELGDTRLEGPFGDHTGYYSPADDYPVFHLTALTHRHEPIYSATVVGRPPMEDSFLGKATERLFLPLLRFTIPEVVDMDLPREGVFHNCAILCIKKTYPKQAQKVASAVWGMGQMQFTKFVVVVDENVDVHDYREVAWRVLNNVDPRRDALLSEGPLDVLDHSSPTALWGSKLGIDATRKWPEEGHPREWPMDTVMDPEVARRVDAMWGGLGLREEWRNSTRG